MVTGPKCGRVLGQKVEGALNTDRLRGLLESDALVQDVMDTRKVHAVRRDMERMEARRLQPHYIATFFEAAFTHLGGALHERERNRYEISHVPAIIRQRDRLIGLGAPVLTRYQRICFEKELRNVVNRPQAEFVCPGHPLLDATVDLILERYRDLMKQGAILVDESSGGDGDESLRALFYLQHAIRDGRPNPDGSRREISRRLQFVEIGLPDGQSEHSEESGADAVRMVDAGMAPYLDYRPLRPDEEPLVRELVERTLATQDLEQAAVQYAIQNLVPEHLAEVRGQRQPLVDKTYAAVKERLTKEITFWDNQAIRLQEQERMGKVNARLNAAMARRRRDDLQARLRARLEDLQMERKIAAKAPNVSGGALVIPIGLIRRLQGDLPDETTTLKLRNKYVEMAAMHTVMAAEQEMGFVPSTRLSHQFLRHRICAREWRWDPTHARSQGVYRRFCHHHPNSQRDATRPQQARKLAAGLGSRAQGWTGLRPALGKPVGRRADRPYRCRCLPATLRALLVRPAAQLRLHG